MVLFRLFTRGLWVSLFFLAIVIFGDFLVPGKLASTVFSPLGVIIIFVTIILDFIFSFHPIDNPEVEK